MSSERQLELAQRHGALRNRIAAQRLALSQHLAPVRSACALGDRALDGVDWLKSHPLAVGGAVAGLAVLKPKRAWRWGRNALALWQGWQRLKNTLVEGR